MSDQFIGEIRMFGGNYAPPGWALCDGRALSANKYSALYSLIGNIYGGSGPDSFNLPDLRSRIPVGQSQGNDLSLLTKRAVGEAFGEESHALTVAEIPAHSHGLNTAKAKASTITAGPTVIYGQVTGTTTNFGLYDSEPSPSEKPTLAVTAITFTGKNAAHSNMMPTAFVNFIIAILGAYPPR